jgi:hypothetical protein
MFVRACVYLGMWGMYIIAAAAVGMCSSLQLGLWMWCRLNLGGGGLLQVDAIGMVVDCCVAGHAASRVPVAAIISPQEKLLVHHGWMDDDSRRSLPNSAGQL